MNHNHQASTAKMKGFHESLGRDRVTTPHSQVHPLRPLPEFPPEQARLHLSPRYLDLSPLFHHPLRVQLVIPLEHCHHRVNLTLRPDESLKANDKHPSIRILRKEHTENFAVHHNLPCVDGELRIIKTPIKLLRRLWFVSWVVIRRNVLMCQRVSGRDSLSGIEDQHLLQKVQS